MNPIKSGAITSAPSCSNNFTILLFPNGWYLIKISPTIPTLGFIIDVSIFTPQAGKPKWRTFETAWKCWNHYRRRDLAVSKAPVLSASHRYDFSYPWCRIKRTFSIGWYFINRAQFIALICITIIQPVQRICKPFLFSCFVIFSLSLLCTNR